MKGRLNRYTCQKCGQGIVTIDEDEGVTPFMLACRATKGCDGIMQSSFYRTDESEGAAQFAWRKPSRKEYEASSPGMKQHFDMGGLDIHQIKRTH